MSDRLREMYHLLGECAEDCDCGCDKEEAIRIEPTQQHPLAATMGWEKRYKHSRDLTARGIRWMRKDAQRTDNPDARRIGRKYMSSLLKKSGGTGKRYESAALFSGLAINEAMERSKEALECGCIDKIEEARDALTMAMCEAGCPPAFHMNKKLGRCARLPPDLHQQVADAHAKSVKARTPNEHSNAHVTMTNLARDLHHQGFHQLGALHAGRAHQHKVAAAN